MQANSVYWIHHPDHIDMFSQGYIGVSNNVESRWKIHKWNPQNGHFKNAINKYGWDTLIKKVILVSDKNYCLIIEEKLRPKNSIGWNIVKGGGTPPITQPGRKMPDDFVPWNKGVPMSEDAKQKMIEKKLGSIPWNKDKKDVMPEPWNKGKKTPDDVRKKQSLAKIGKPSHRKGAKHTLETIEKIKANKPKTVLSEAGRAALIKAHKGKKYELVTCPHCGKIGGLTAMPRWHFDKCKEK